jgi:integrase
MSEHSETEQKQRRGDDQTMGFTDLGISRLNVKRTLERINKDRREKLNNPNLKALNQAQIWDEGCAGLSLLISGERTKTFRATFKLNGEWISHKLGRFGEMVPDDASAKNEKHRLEKNLQITEARRLTTNYRTLAKEGTDPRKQSQQPTKPSALTYGAVVEQYIEKHAKPNQRTWDQTERTLKKWCADWWDIPIADITKKHAHDLLDKIKAEGHDYKAVLTLRWLKALWKWAWEREFVTQPVMGAVRFNHKKRKRDRVYNEDEIKAIWQASDQLDQSESAYVKLLILLAPRKTALALMRYSDLRDFDKVSKALWITPFEHTKSRATASERTYETPLPPLAQQIIKRLPKRDMLVFQGLSVHHTKAGRPVFNSKSLQQKLERHGAPKQFNFHATRHTLATWLQNKGHSAPEVGLCLNHASSGTVTSGYMHSYALDLKRKLLLKWANHVVKLVHAKAPARKKGAARKRADNVVAFPAR